MCTIGICDHVARADKLAIDHLLILPLPCTYSSRHPGVITGHTTLSIIFTNTITSFYVCLYRSCDSNDVHSIIYYENILSGISSLCSQDNLDCWGY